jgi:hypothetical protein
MTFSNPGEKRNPDKLLTAEALGHIRLLPVTEDR